jgi:hypothetical protein
LIAVIGSVSCHKLDCIAKLAFQRFDIHFLV